MTDDEILGRLCWYDPRNPDYDAEFADGRQPAEKMCSCDNCFYGRHKLAVEIISLRETLLKIATMNRGTYDHDTDEMVSDCIIMAQEALK